jgi:hypothetical protein
MSTSFTAMTWNVENLFPPGHPSTRGKWFPKALAR